MGKMTIQDIALSFGTTESDLSSCMTMFDEMDLSYREVTGTEESDLMQEVLHKIESDTQVIGAPERKQVWHNGWQENLDQFLSNKDDLSAVVPKFIKSGQALRWKQKYIMSDNEHFERDYITLFQSWFFKKYLHEYEHVYEFGCGSGMNLVPISRIFPDKHLTGLDFVDSSVNLIKAIAEHHNLLLEAFIFDMIKPNYDIDIKPQSCVFTLGAVEQLAGAFMPFLQFFIDKKPSLCIHIEPTIELYDESNSIDCLAIKFHKKRGYTVGLLPMLQQLHEQKVIDLIKVHRVYFGSLYNEGYNYMIWRPL